MAGELSVSVAHHMYQLSHRRYAELPVIPSMNEQNDIDYDNQAAFRHALRQFLRFSEEVTGEIGGTPQQYQTMLAIKASQGKTPITIGELADAMLLWQHSVSALLDRLEAQGLAERQANPNDRRQIHISLTERGEAILDLLVRLHQNELRRLGNLLMAPLQRIVDGGTHDPELSLEILADYKTTPRRKKSPDAVIS